MSMFCNNFNVTKNYSSLDDTYIEPLILQLNNTHKINILFEIHRINENLFLSKKDKDNIIKKLYQKLKIRMMMKKIIFRKRNYYIQNYDYSDQISLSLEPLTNYSNKDLIKIYDFKKIWVFTNIDIIRIFRSSIMNQDNFFALPKIPKNPFTNQEFNYGQLHNILKQLKYTSIKIPIYILFFLLSDFNLDKMLANHQNYFDFQALNQEIHKMSDRQYKIYIKYIIRKNSEYKLCKHCFKKLGIENIKNIFGHIVRCQIIQTQLPFLNNDIFIKENIGTQIDKIMIKFPKLNFKNHYMDHRKTIKIKNKFYKFYKNRPLNFNFSPPIPSGKIFIFTAGSFSSTTKPDWLNLKEIQRLFPFSQIDIRMMIEKLHFFSDSQQYLDNKNFEQCLDLIFKTTKKKVQNNKDIYRKNFIIKRLFLFFDNKKYGMIQCIKIATGLSLLCNGDIEDITFAIFSLYDIENKGNITLKQFRIILSSLYNIIYCMDSNKNIEIYVTEKNYITSSMQEIMEEYEITNNLFSYYDFQVWFKKKINLVRKIMSEKKRKRDKRRIKIPIQKGFVKI